MGQKRMIIVSGMYSTELVSVMAAYQDSGQPARMLCRGPGGSPSSCLHLPACCEGPACGIASSCACHVLGPDTWSSLKSSADCIKRCGSDAKPLKHRGADCLHCSCSQSHSCCTVVQAF